jgi:hypothetical protein
VTGVRLFHIASHNLHNAKILTRNILGDMIWFKTVMSEIYRTYAQLASAITPNLKRKINRSMQREYSHFDE